MRFIVGQRWLSHPEPQLGLGQIIEVEIRRISVEFPAAEEVRTYSLDNAPLSRIAYREGEVILTDTNISLTISAVNEMGGILFYTGFDEQNNELTIAEQQLSAHVQLTGALSRLCSGQGDNNAAFELRLQTLTQHAKLQQTITTGLLGARTSLLPHQIYIANKVAKRYAPRVLLADEVGLGKTIEAGLILHQQLLTGLSTRVLILLPPALQHQWLVEMLRRFNLKFSLFDDERYSALIENNEENPFETEQLILCSIDWLAASPSTLQDAISADWDLLVVDEAHHLHWSEQESSPQYQCVEALAKKSTGLILLTATPEQAGLDSHFARLRLLDPARFSSLKKFKEESSDYQLINKIVRDISTQNTIEQAHLAEISNLLKDDSVKNLQDKAAIIQYLLDRHGTGRVLFRNTRAAVGGFPERHLHAIPLPNPTVYQFASTLLTPEESIPSQLWLKQDPRVEWLEKFLKKIKPAKVLVICAQAKTALALEEYLHLRAGIRSTSFHEGLTLLERDRSAAWFAESETGAQALICSEMGSEGRNFQFAQHLVLFDLPLNPDLLEQRIGRIDRIGQGPKIETYVPYLLGTAQEKLFRWYHEGLNLFQKTFAAGYSLYEQFSDRLHQQLDQLDDDNAIFEKLLKDTALAADATRVALAEGRDALLELSSCNREQAQHIIQSIIDTEENDHLQDFMQNMWDHFCIDHEHHSENAIVVRPSEQMLVSHFPELTEDGLTATFNRQHALERDDMEFLTWEHPMVQGAIEMLLGAEFGNAAMASITLNALPAGAILLEAIYNVECSAPKQLQVNKFLPNTPLRFLVDSQNRDLSKPLPHDKLNLLCKDIPRKKIATIISQVRSTVMSMHDYTEKLAHKDLLPLIKSAKDKLSQSLSLEINRLESLQKINPTIRNEEITFLKEQLRLSDAAIDKAAVQLQGLRLIINTKT